jgi:hypothetical protein
MKEIFRVVATLYSFYLGRGDVRRAHELAAQLVEIGRKNESGFFLLEAYVAIRIILYL